VDDGEASEPGMPAVVRRLVSGESVDLVWRNVLGGLTYRMGVGSSRDRFIKWGASHGQGA
jgi:hypothetical protein